MIRGIIATWAAILILGMAVNVNATLIIQTSGDDTVVFDDVSLLYWYRDLDAFNYMTYASQLSVIENLSDLSGPYFGQTGWHMATRTEIESLWDYAPAVIAMNFIPNMTYNSNGYNEVWSGRYDVVSSGVGGEPAHQVASIGSTNGEITSSYIEILWGANDSEIMPYFSTWVVSASPVPEPTTMLLFGTGLIGLAGIRRKRKK